LGDAARSLFDIEEPKSLDQAVRFKVTDRRQVGDDQRVIAVPQLIKG
jgi:diaminohydroxyphosphoribosylaminopyrimidine deaminase/5-amino-6-(5-phosphoribosylamino)uracil reductase